MNPRIIFPLCYKRQVHGITNDGKNSMSVVKLAVFPYKCKHAEARNKHHNINFYMVGASFVLKL